MKKVYIVGIGGIGVSAIARYYKESGYEVYGSDKNNSQLIENLQSEGINIHIGERPKFIDASFERIIYSEAIPETQSERIEALKYNIKSMSYPQSIGEIGNSQNFIAIAGTHGKSTTTSMTSLLLKDSNHDFTAIVGTLLKEFGGKNFYHRSKHPTKSEDYFLVEACEYKRSFLNYQPNILAITNIEVDHLDYYKDESDYISAYASAIKNIKSGGYVILNKNEENSVSLGTLRDDIHYVWIDDQSYIYKEEIYTFPEIQLQLKGDHILFDAKIVYIIGKILELSESDILTSLEAYQGAWRRMEQVGRTQHNNLVISDYAHHPTEIKKTLSSLQESFPEKHILTIFQPHQYSRTLELLNDFIESFQDTDMLIIPNIYESRDSIADKKKIDTDKLIQLIKHSNKYNGNGLENTVIKIGDIEKEYENNKLIIVLMGAGDIDSLRNILVKK